MTNFPALDVAIGLAFLYFVLALVCSALNEALAGAFKWRAQELEKALRQVLGTEKAEARFFAHPLITIAVDPHRRRKNPHAAQSGGPLQQAWQRFRRTFTRSRRYPSYLHSRTVVAALLSLEPDAKMTTAAAPTAVPERLATADTRELEAAIRAIESPRTVEALLALFKAAGWDPIAFRGAAERWYDDQMERVSGWYRRRIQWWIALWAIVIAFTLNADTLRIANVLWTQPSVRSALVNQANAAVAGTNGPTGPTGVQNSVNELRRLPVPLGWHFTKKASDSRSFPFWGPYELVAKLIGLLLTAVALSLGAPFWFDALSKIARLRNGGAPPPATGAVRHGEGEETRAA
jgi:hypothetical protein